MCKNCQIAYTNGTSFQHLSGMTLFQEEKMHIDIEEDRRSESLRVLAMIF